jgi:hypothetical protein
MANGRGPNETVAYLQLLGKVLPLQRETVMAPKELLTRVETPLGHEVPWHADAEIIG